MVCHLITLALQQTAAIFISLKQYKNKRYAYLPVFWLYKIYKLQNSAYKRVHCREDCTHSVHPELGDRCCVELIDLPAKPQATFLRLDGDRQVTEKHVSKMVWWCRVPVIIIQLKVDLKCNSHITTFSWCSSTFAWSHRTWPFTFQIMEQTCLWSLCVLCEFSASIHTHIHNTWTHQPFILHMLSYCPVLIIHHIHIYIFKTFKLK